MLATSICPLCNSRSMRRSKRRNVAEWLISAALLPWRCEHCQARFFRIRNELPFTSPKRRDYPDPPDDNDAAQTNV